MLTLEQVLANGEDCDVIGDVEMFVTVVEAGWMEKEYRKREREARAWLSALKAGVGIG